MKTKYIRITKFTLAMLILLIVQFSNVVAQEPLQPTAKDKCVSGDCKNGYGKIIYSTGDSYEGNYVNGFANGKGKEIHVDGSVYEGDFVSGKFAGQGIYTFKNGVVYVGQFANNLYNGKGKIKFANGNSYDGDWVNGKYEGQGTYTFKDGSYYIGEWKNGKYNGYGKQYDKSINKLAEGTWKDDILVNSTAAAAVTPTGSDKCISGDCVNGKGKIIYTNGNIYEGDFVDGKRKGQGKYTYKNGQVYIGQFYDDLRNGKGKFTFSDGSSYEGSFVTDNFIGYGTYTSKSGSNQTGKFTVGQIVDLQSKVLDTDFWGKAEIIEILGDKYKVRDLRFKTIEIVAEQKIRPFTEPVKYEIGQKVEVLNLGIWYKGEIIGLEIESNDHYRIRFEGTTNRSDSSENVRNIRPGIASSTAQIKREIPASTNNGNSQGTQPNASTTSQNTQPESNSGIYDIIAEIKSEAIRKGGQLLGSGIYDYSVPFDPKMFFELERGKTYVFIAVKEYDPTFRMDIISNGRKILRPTHSWDERYEVASDAEYGMKFTLNKDGNYSVLLMNLSLTRNSGIWDVQFSQSGKVKNYHWLFFKLR